MSCTLSHRHCGDLAGDRQRRGGEHCHFVPARVTYGAMEVHLLNKFLCLKRDEWAWDKKRSRSLWPRTSGLQSERRQHVFFPLSYPAAKSVSTIKGIFIQLN